jgi:hypothetical protein
LGEASKTIECEDRPPEPPLRVPTFSEDISNEDKVDILLSVNDTINGKIGEKILSPDCRNCRTREDLCAARRASDDCRTGAQKPCKAKASRAWMLSLGEKVCGTESGRQCVYQGPREARRCRVERSRGVAGSALPRVTGRKTFRLERIEGNLIEPEPMAASPTTCDVGKIDRPLAGDLRMAQGPVAWGPWVPKIFSTPKDYFGPSVQVGNPSL